MAERGGKREERRLVSPVYFQEGWVPSKSGMMDKQHSFLWAQKHEKLILVYEVCMGKLLSIRR